MGSREHVLQQEKEELGQEQYREMLSKTFGRIETCLRAEIWDVFHADFMMRHICMRWPETAKSKKCAGLVRKIDLALDKRRKPVGHSPILKDIIENDVQDNVRSEWKRLMVDVKSYYDGPKKSFTYFLIDLNLLPEPPALPSFSQFVSGIFYVGKGSGERPRDHPLEALRIDRNDLPLQGKKIQKIRALLDGRGAIGIVRTNLGSSSDEALAYEASMIRCLGIGSLTNTSHGGVPQGDQEEDVWESNKEKRTKKRKKAKKAKNRWTDVQLSEIGAECLLQAWKSRLVIVTKAQVANREKSEWEDEKSDGSEEDHLDPEDEKLVEVERRVEEKEESEEKEEDDEEEKPKKRKKRNSKKKKKRSSHEHTHSRKRNPTNNSPKYSQKKKKPNY